MNHADEKRRLSHARLQHVADYNPDALLEIIAEKNGYSEATRSIAAEIAGSVCGVAAFDVLQFALRDNSPVVREGAALGIAAIAGNCVRVLRSAAKEDWSKGVREALREAVRGVLTEASEIGDDS